MNGDSQKQLFIPTFLFTFHGLHDLFVIFHVVHDDNVELVDCR